MSAAIMAAVDSLDGATGELPSPPFILVPGLPNFRDAGGYEVISDPTGTYSSEGKRRTNIVRRGILFRASEPSKLTDDGAIQLSQQLGIKVVYDLRSPVEIARGLGTGHGFPLREWEGSERKFVPVFLDQDYSPEALALRYKNYAAESEEGFIEAYQDILNAATDPSNEFQPFKAILGHLAAAPGGDSAPLVPSPCLVHCTAGKDRTGVVVALALSLCGVPDEAVVHEYNLTEIGLRSRLEELVRHVSSNPKIGIDVEGAKRMCGARKEAMLGTLARIRKQHGSVEQCVIDLGILTQQGIEQLRKNLIVEVDEDEVIRWQDHVVAAL
ncbi:tyrosine phosphatase [Astrocystis sublimbata]|nr:tyrosine phosphatase [Astrocystis sublimbata]